MIAITLPDAATARAISRGMWRLSRPESVAEAADDVTEYLAPVIGTALLVDPEWTLPIHPRVTAQLLDPADAAGTQAELAALLVPLLANPADLVTVAAMLAAGGTLRVGDLLALLRPALVGPPPGESAP